MNNRQISSAYSFLVFVFFIAGGIAASLTLTDFPDIPGNIPLPENYAFVLVPIVLSFFLAMTVLGVFLLPVCSFVCGAFIACQAQGMLSQGTVCGDYRDGCAFLCVLVPAFFVICSGGMQSSALIREALAKAGAQSKTSFRSYILAAVAAGAAVCLAGYIINKI